MADLWTKVYERFNEWTSPLRPTPEDVEMFKNQIGANARTLLLGVTSELLPYCAVAVDNNAKMVEKYPGQAVLGSWENLPFGPEFDVVVGDGCLTVFQGAAELLFQQAKKVLKRGGRLVLRTYISPETKEDLTWVLGKKGEMGFHAYKIRVAHALANPYVSVQDLYRVIQPVYDHPTLEIYRGSNLIYYFPKLSELPRWDWIQFGKSYELADRCPVITWRF